MRTPLNWHRVLHSLPNARRADYRRWRSVANSGIGEYRMVVAAVRLKLFVRTIGSQRARLKIGMANLVYRKLI
jgi:hypothetical protein